MPVVFFTAKRGIVRKKKGENYVRSSSKQSSTKFLHT